ncbi:endopeptidase La [bacterium]|nr:endopeptidase La [bacterium]
MDKKTQNKIPENLPVIPTMDVVVFPQMIVPLLVLDKRIIKGINNALEGSKMVLLLAAKKQVDQQEAIGTKDLYHVGTVASIMRLIKIPDGGIKILVQGICKANALSLSTTEETLSATIEPSQTIQNVEDETEILAQIKSIKVLAEKIASSGQTFSPDFHIILSRMNDPDKIADFVLSHLNITVKEAQDLLEQTNKKDLLRKLYNYLYKEIEVTQMQEKIKSNARDSMNKSQKEYYLREQLRAIKQELGENEEEEIDKLREKLDKLKLTDEVRQEVTRQVNRLETTAPESMEAMVIRNYLEWIFALPWSKETQDNLDITHAKKILDEDHYGLQKIKERILDFISVRNLKKDSSAPILCFVGPPGTGKTSLGKSIARSLGRSHFRVSLGGVRDESEIRGHRRTYVGAMPGRFIQGIKKAGTSNPIIIIDELDKIGADFRGDPSAAMLEVLDPQQNKTFYDNYLGVPFDLSKSIFIATANSLDTISAPLRDRMEIIQLDGYTMQEKLHIAKNHLIDRAVESSGVKELSLKDEVLETIISNYTRESGVRQLSRVMHKLCSKSARSIVEKNKPVIFTTKNIENYLGPKMIRDEETEKRDQVGITNGLAWTAYGGEMLKIEAVLVPGQGKLILTGQLGDVMKESAQAAMSYARANADKFKITPEAFSKNDLHIHVPAGAVPKDGPSAGITMLTSILSVLTGKPISSDYAMTGELNLRGHVMPIGGVKEKVLAAKRNNIGNILLPEKNRADLKDANEITQGINIIWVKKAEDVIPHVIKGVI